jgi:hypothetical protein
VVGRRGRTPHERWSSLRLQVADERLDWAVDDLSKEPVAGAELASELVGPKRGHVDPASGASSNRPGATPKVR